MEWIIVLTISYVAQLVAVGDYPTPYVTQEQCQEVADRLVKDQRIQTIDGHTVTFICTPRLQQA